MSIALSALHRICTLLIIAGFQMALYWGSYISKVVEYLLVDAWDIENSYSLHTLFWYKPWRYDPGGSRDLDSFFRFSRRLSALGQAVQADDIHNVVQREPFGRISYPTSEAPNHSEHFKFLISQGADIEYRDPNSRETALLVAAEEDGNIRLELMPVLWRLGADYSAVDYKGRGPLHLTLKPSRIWVSEDQGLLFYRPIKDKLVHLLQAGCSIHAVDNYGRTPTDVARIWRRTKAWEAALQEVGKLECARSKCQCEIIVRLPQALRLSEERLTLVTKDRDRRATDICRRLMFPNLAMQLRRQSVMNMKRMSMRTRMSVP